MEEKLAFVEAGYAEWYSVNVPFGAPLITDGDALIVEGEARMVQGDMCYRCSLLMRPEIGGYIPVQFVRFSTRQHP